MLTCIKRSYSAKYRCSGFVTLSIDPLIAEKSGVTATTEFGTPVAPQLRDPESGFTTIEGELRMKGKERRTTNK